ncbi:hypothetical protein AVEN_167434-1 [Araneus ventricosus]|uniref:Uncharacterized protein n=1 Tax=Araneus ventricosus TaxID=182803 RepID=A0A4Y2EPW5_ARAVE|nr:hypothetical protein AVEN_167434-1 [Araneus ventricosus]
MANTVCCTDVDPTTEARTSLSLVILTSRFEVIRGLFWDGPCNFEQRSDDEDDIWVGTPLSKLPHHTTGRTFDPLYDLTCNSPDTTDLQWNRFSHLEPTGSIAGTLPLGHRGLFLLKEGNNFSDEILLND